MKVDYCELAKKYQTPLFIFDQDLFISRIQQVKNAFFEEFEKLGISTQFYYAGKAFLTKYIAQLAVENKMGIDTCSLFESLTALNAGIDGSYLGLHGNNKSDQEIALALQKNFARIVIDSEEEIERISSITEQLRQSGQISQNQKAKVMLRITTGIHAGGHEYISTAHEDQKFGISLSDGYAQKVCEMIIQKAKQFQTLQFVGLHTHIGSQIFEPDAFVQSAQKMLDLWLKVKVQADSDFNELDLGGGFGIAYTDEETELDLNLTAQKVAAVFSEQREKTPELLGGLKVSFEPGRFIMGPSASTVYQIGTIKDVPIGEGRVRRYVSVDGGMSDNIRPALYGAKYQARALGVSHSTQTVDCRVVGKHCESGDILIDSAQLPIDIQRGDFLQILCTGAYGYSMASNYNLLPKPAVIAISREFETEKVIIPRQNEEDLVK
jgi:diaminopimelate decarboxylase